MATPDGNENVAHSGKNGMFQFKNNQPASRPKKNNQPDVHQIAAETDSLNEWNFGLALLQASPFHGYYWNLELTITEIKAEMEKTLHWFVPMAANTAKYHHCFGWIGEWLNTGSEANRQPAPQTEVIRIETFHHANREKTEAFVLELVLWLHYMASQSQRSHVKSTAQGHSLPKTNKQLKDIPPPAMLTTDDLEMLQDVRKRRRVRGISKSQDFDNVSYSLGENRSRLNKSSSYSSGEGTEKLLSFSRLSFGFPVIDFDTD